MYRIKKMTNLNQNIFQIDISLIPEMTLGIITLRVFSTISS
ncbi:MAG: hypothetical protein ACJARX_002044 [Psychroserpens sp.]|jgi:hypothetical protein